MSAGPRPDDRVIVLFGGTGDLARRKLMPGLFHLHVAGLLPREYRIVGSAPPLFALSGISSAHMPEMRSRSSASPSRTIHPGQALSSGFRSEWRNQVTAPSWKQPSSGLRRRSATHGPLYHLAVPPAAFFSMMGMLGESGLAKGARVIIEKPFGTDLASARAQPSRRPPACALSLSCLTRTVRTCRLRSRSGRAADARPA
jgi:glucose-6-phosphate 1-dehydrogenase